MKINTNAWNKFRYTLYAPGYDKVANLLKNSRQKSIETLPIRPNDSVLIIGAGTGLDLEFLPEHCRIVATDITPAMVERIIKRNNSLHRNVQALVMDGQSLEFEANSFDHILLHLILSVIPDPYACLKESERVVKPGGHITIFDKFIRPNTNISLLRRMINLFANFFFTDINRSFESIVKQTRLAVLSDEPDLFNGNFRIIHLIKK